ncbi:MAG: hypothetical protein WCJ04_03755 [Actinomycetes bacterium]
MSNAPSAPASKPPKGALITGIVLMLLAFSSCGVGGLSCVSFAASFADILSGASTVALGETTSLDAASSTGVVVSSSADVACEGQDENGSKVTFAEPSAGSTGTVSSGGETFNFMYSFDTNSGSKYTVVCVGSELSDGQYAVASFPGFAKVGVGIAGIISGFFLIFLGAIFFIVGLVKRSKWKKRQGNSVTGPPTASSGDPAAGVAPPPLPGAAQAPVPEAPRIEAPTPWMPQTPTLPTPPPTPGTPTSPDELR